MHQPAYCDVCAGKLVLDTTVIFFYTGITERYKEPDSNIHLKLTIQTSLKIL